MDAAVIDIGPASSAFAAACIRPVRAGDLAVLVELCAEHAAFEKAEFDPAGKAEALGTALFSPCARLHAWIAWDGDCALGYAAASGEFSTWAAREYLHLDCLFLRASARGCGVGAALLQAVVALAQARGIEELQWQTPDWNAAAIRFYRRLGARAKTKMRFALRAEPDQASLRGSAPITLGVPT